MKHKIKSHLSLIEDSGCVQKSCYSIFLMILLMSIVNGQFDYFMYVTPDNPITSVSTLYTFDIYQTLPLDIPANTRIEINFPT